MTVKNDGGAAFPHSFEDSSGHPRWKQSEGLSIRDWFAGQALAGMLANAAAYTEVCDFPRDAYWYADAMLAARENNNG